MPTEQELQAKIDSLEQEVRTLKSTPTHRGIRKRSSRTVMGLPLWEVATGPDLDAGEMRGRAKAIFAFGDIATGVFAFGGIATGVVAAGGVSVGLFCFGGVALGLLAGCGGLATGALAYGGLALGHTAIGGLAVGYFAAGGKAIGTHVIDAMQRDPEAVQHFSQFSALLPSDVAEALRLNKNL